MTLNGVMALCCVISANSGSFRAHCVKVHVRYLISWWVVVHYAVISYNSSQADVTADLSPFIRSPNTSCHGSPRCTLRSDTRPTTNPQLRATSLLYITRTGPSVKRTRGRPTYDLGLVDLTTQPFDLWPAHLFSLDPRSNRCAAY